MKHIRTWTVSHLILLLTSSIISPCESSKRGDDSSLDVVSWLSEQSDEFFIHPSLVVQKAGGFILKEDAEEIKQSEILMVIPSSAILSAVGQAEEEESDDDEEEEEVKEHDDDPICDLFDALWNEVQLEGESKYAPYIDQLAIIHGNSHQKHVSVPRDHGEQSEIMPMPSTWSFTGRRLLAMVNNGSPQDDMVKLLEGYQHCFTDEDEDEDMADLDGALHSADLEASRILQDESEDDDSDDDSEDEEEERITEPPPFITLPPENRALELSGREKLQRRVLEMALQHQIDWQFLVPLYDQISHHHYDYNVVHQRNQGSGAFHVVATRSLKPGDKLTRPSQTCLKDCDQKRLPPTEERNHATTSATMLGALKLFGQVQRYPHYWEFQTGLSFVYHGGTDSDDDATVDEDILSGSQKTPLIEWIRVPTENWQLEYMEAEISRQAKLYEMEVLRSIETVPVSEWNQVKRYSHSVRSALALAVMEGRKLVEMRLRATDKEHAKDIISPSEQAFLESIGRTSTSNGTDYPASEEANGDEVCDPLKDCSVDQIGVQRGCSLASRNVPSVERDASEWHLMRTSYVNAVGQKKATIQATPGSGFRRPYKVAHSPARGRGVFATEDVPKGALLWTAEYTAWFEEGDEFRRFLAPLADDIVCDLLIWCYTCTVPGVKDVVGDVAEDPPKRHVIGCDLDAGSLFNSYDDIAEYNAGTVDILELKQYSNLDSSVYATRDIAAGEEFVTAYDEFDTHDYTMFGL